MHAASQATRPGVRALHPLFGAEILGVSLRDVDDEIFARVSGELGTYGVCLVRGEALTNEQHIALSRRFGPLQLAPVIDGGKSKPRLPYPELFDISNFDEEGRVLALDDLRRLYAKGNAYWHTDSSFNQQRAAFSLLHAHEVSPGGSRTEFVDMRVAYENLPEATKRSIEDLVVEHSIWHSRALGGYPEPTEEMRRSRPPARHKLVQLHKESGRKTLYLASHATHVVGWPIDEGKSLIQELMAGATREDLIYAHEWRVGDLLMWDNRCTMHRVTSRPGADPMQRRDLRRTTAREASGS